MPQVISSTVLRNSYNEVSERCKNSTEPLFVTKNGKGDLAIMGIDSYEHLSARIEFYEFLMQGHRDVEHGRTLDAHEASKAIRAELGL